MYFKEKWWLLRNRFFRIKTGKWDGLMRKSNKLRIQYNSENGEYYFKEHRPVAWSLIFSGERNSETVWPMKRSNQRRINGCMKQGP